MPNCTTTC